MVYREGEGEGEKKIIYALSSACWGKSLKCNIYIYIYIYIYICVCVCVCRDIFRTFFKYETQWWRAYLLRLSTPPPKKKKKKKSSKRKRKIIWIWMLFIKQKGTKQNKAKQGFKKPTSYLWPKEGVKVWTAVSWRCLYVCVCVCVVGISTMYVCVL